MNNFKRALVFLSVVLLGFTSFNYYSISASSDQNVQIGDDQYLSSANIFSWHFISEKPVQQFNLIKGDFPFLKYEPNFAGSHHIFQCIAAVISGSDYLSVSDLISIPLRVSVIIFPFHYFW